MSKKTIKSIHTPYAGCYFRSRLEARWAVFMDQVGLEWRYEPEGFETPFERYLPDFHLPGPDAWLEVKGGTFTARDRMRAEFVADQTWTERGSRFRVLQGDLPRPGMRTMVPIGGKMRETPGILCLTRHVAYDVVQRIAAETGNSDITGECTQSEPRAWTRGIWLGDWTAEQLDVALAAARSARFGT